MKAIIIAAGKATRWNNYLGVPKHFIEIDSEPIIARTVRLLNKYNVADISVVANDDRYDIPGSSLYKPAINYADNADADKFLSSRELWSKTGRTLVLYGDCFFTEEAIETIVNYNVREWTLFCRPHKSKITGAKWGECFCQSFYPEHIEAHEKALYRIVNLYKRKVINRCGGWEHYRAMMGRPDNMVRLPHTMSTNYVIIDDWTDDFDNPDDYNNWIERWKNRE